MSVSLAAACGDDDGDGGTAGGGGTGGRAGAAGAAGTAGAAGSGGAAGRAGSGGAAGTGGSNAGTGGGGAGGSSTAGTGGSGTAGTNAEPPDAGPDAADGGDIGDAGNGDCPNFATTAQGVDGQTNQQVVISRVVFEGGGATVTLRGVGDGQFNFGDPMRLCAGPSNDQCLEDEVQGIDDVDDAFAVGQEAAVFISDVDPAGGELALINDDPVVADAPVFAYIAWGDYISEDPEGGDAAEPPTSLEARAIDAGFWTDNDQNSRIEVGDDNTIFILGANGGDSQSADGYNTCTGELD
jgi:hypothetical protein